MAIEERPGMYFSPLNIYTLHAFICGYLHACDCDEYSDMGPNNFQKWVAERYLLESNRTWAHIINYKSENEYEAVRVFFKIFNQYIEEKKVSDATNL